MTSPEDYRKYCGWMFDEESTSIINSHIPENARILTDVMIGRAEKEILILSQKLDPVLFDRREIFSALAAASLKGVEIRILTQEVPTDPHFLPDLERYRKSPTSILHKPASPGSKAAEAIINFIVVDGKSFRFQKDLADFNGYVSSNQPDLGKRMVELFHQLWGN